MDKPGKTQCVSPTLPTDRRLPNKLYSTPQQHGMILISGNGEITSQLTPLAYSSPEAVQTTGTVAEVILPFHQLDRDDHQAVIDFLKKL
jgi:hypothetical protein